MLGSRSRLTPQMKAYEEKFADSGDVRWLPYLMYFHPALHGSDVVNTDGIGFRYSECNGRRYSVGDHEPGRATRLLAGSSTVFGIGATADRWTLSSRLSENDARAQPWLNFGGRSFNSTQELMLLALYRHLLPPVQEIVLFSGFNNLGLARLPSSLRQEHGAFFNCGEFFEALGAGRRKALKGVGKNFFGRGRQEEAPPSVEQQIHYAAELTLRHLQTWRSIAQDIGAKLTYVLQPLAGWVRPHGCRQEEELFAELDQLGQFTEVYGDILRPEVCLEYADALRSRVESLGVRFVNMSPILSAALEPDQWLFVDRIHFTDQGHDFVARHLLDILQ